MCDQYHTTKKISVGDYAERIVDHFNWLDENKELSYYGDMKLGDIIETPKFELDGFLDTLVEDLNRYNGRLKQELLNNVDWIGQKIVHGTRRKIETNDKMHRDILKYWLWKWNYIWLNSRKSRYFGIYTCRFTNSTGRRN